MTVFWAGPLWRGPEPVVAAPRDLPLTPRTLPDGTAPLRIVALGTSLTARGPWPDHLAARLAACLDHSVEIIRIARPGANVSWAAHPDRIAAVVAEAPDIVLLEFAINDADLRDGLAREAADALTRGLLEDLAEAVPEAALIEMTMSPARGARGLLRPGLAARYGDVVARGGDANRGVVDLYTRWIALPRHQRGLADGLHPDPSIAAQVTVPPLAAYLAEGFGAACPQDQPLEPLPPS
ncbi:SGNH/GDSL hydrolase family protein [Gymnodinialimonas ulvae]|uniref:SGNH/GDSL hydrolase family protein n=1 Tax=Gymnodinialimonas ulvae TaxID=3126504 RepID=UPI0030A66DED